MLLIIVSFLAGILSVLAPCVLPVIPVIFSGTLSGEKNSQTRRVIVSMVISIVVFTFLLKASTLFITIDPSIRTTISALIILVYGLVLIFPSLWEKLSAKMRFDRVNTLSEKASEKKGFRGDILLGASLGPIFSTCSPTYALLLSTVLPINLSLGIICMIAYAIGFGGFLYILVKGGKSLIKKFYGISSTNGRFKKILGIILIITGLLIITGYMKKLEVVFVTYLPDIGQVEQLLIKKSKALGNIDGTGTIPKKIIQTGNTQGERLLNVNYPAPEFAGLSGRINSSGYTSISQLKGKVVLVDFRTYSCINCIRTLSYLQGWHMTYKDDGLVIIGIHAPEFAFERIFENVLKASKEFGLTYPIVQDNNFATWQNYNNHYWPAKYLIDREGNVRYQHFGEGSYDETEKVIQYLLGTKNNTKIIEKASLNKASLNKIDLNKFEAGNGTKTQETYLGTARRGSNLIWKVDSERDEDEEKIVLKSSTGSLDIVFQAKTINLVLDAPKATKVVVKEGNQIINTFIINGSKLYNIAHYPNNGQHSISIEFEDTGVQAYAFTFG